jgi:TfoX/Sxy family transcriptional regulator of competence genes
MPYNLDLEYRIDHFINRFGEITKKKMFGGVGYLLNGNMCFGIHKEYLIIRTSIETASIMLKEQYSKPFDITGKPMKGWVMISPDYVETDEQLLEFMGIGASFAKSLPIK